MKKKKLTVWERFLESIGWHLWNYSARPDLKDPDPKFQDGRHFYRFCVRCGRDEHLDIYRSY